VRRGPDGTPRSGRLALADGAQLELSFADGQASALVGADGVRADIEWSKRRATVTFVGPTGAEAGDGAPEASVLVPVGLRPALRLARADPSPGWGKAPAAGMPWITTAYAQEPEADDDDEAKEASPPIAVEETVTLELGLRASARDERAEGEVQLEARCDAPLTCVVRTPTVRMPATVDVEVVVAGRVEKQALGTTGDLDPFRDEAEDERVTAQRQLDDVAAAMAAVGVVALACDEADRADDVCVRGLGRRGAYLSRAEAAVQAIVGHEVDTQRGLDLRAQVLRDRDAARRQLDREVTVEVCASRPGYTRVCTEAKGRPFGSEPFAPPPRTLDLRPGLGGTLVGSYQVTQSDGRDCKFSPSPETSGPLNLSFDEKTGVMTATYRAQQSGTRPGLRCSLGTANMRWEQNYSATATQRISPEQLRSGGRIPLRLRGTMSGTGSYSFSGCRTGGGAAANCPAGRRDPYNYPVEINGQLDLATQTGSGNIVISGAPLPTRGTWRVPAAGEAAP
ncbi:MAG: hypothetical protein AAF715_20230, partial [Myxococcota bacterium]